MEVFDSTQISSEEMDSRLIDSLGAITARHIINLTMMKTVVKKSDIVKMILGGKKGLFPPVFERAKDILREIYNYKLVEEKDTKDVIIFCIQPESIGKAEYIAPKEHTKLIFLYIVLSYIFLKGGKVSEQALIGFLNKLNIFHPEDDYFGNIQELLNSQLPAEYYLKKDKEKDHATGDVTVFFSFGLKSTVEIDKDRLLDQLAQLMNKTKHSFAYLNNSITQSETIPEED